MTEDSAIEVPVWTLATEDVEIPLAGDFLSMTPARLSELRSVLAALAETPIATLEAHPAASDIDTSGGLPLGAASPLAQSLSQLAIQLSAQTSQTAGGTVYRMVLPAKVAAQVGANLLRPMPAKAGGVHSALIGPNGIAAQARFVPMAGGTTSTLTKVTLAAPLIVSAVAACASIRAEQQRHQAIERITELLQKLHQERLDDERNDLDGCRSSITKATAILLDRGLIGDALGLGPAVYTIETAVASARRRVGRWKESLAGISAGPVELHKVKRLFPGITTPSGEFHAHVELTRAAIALKRRVIVLQAVEQAQLNPDNTFEQFVKVLQQEQSEIDELESHLNSVLLGLSRLDLDRSHGVRDFAFSSAQVDELLKASRLFRTFREPIDQSSGGAADVTIEMVRNTDGSVIVFPALPAAS